MISFSFSNRKNIKKLMKFLGSHWQKNYILSKNLKLFNWQHCLNKKKEYNFVIAKLNSKIVGCLGFINHSNFSSKLKKNDTLWLVNWLVTKKSSVSGLEFISFLSKKLNFSRIGTVGGNNRTQAILDKLGFEVGMLNHYFVVNPRINNFQIAKVKALNKKKIGNTSKISPKKILCLKGKLNLKIFGKKLNSLIRKFGKDETFFRNRYELHPYYNYKIYLIFSTNNVDGFFVTRICKFKEKKALRIIDFFGHEKALIGIKEPLEKLIININAEYVDFYEYGIKKYIMSKTGLSKNKFNKKIIIPNHFEPYERKNIILSWASRSHNSFMKHIFKGDCDQDRPSII